MKIIVLLSFILFISCHDSFNIPTEEQNVHAFSLGIEEYSESSFNTEIKFLNINIFQKMSNNFYRLIYTENLDSAQIVNLINNGQIYSQKFDEGSYFVSFVANYHLQLSSNSTPNDILINYPPEGIERSYYSAYQEINVQKGNSVSYNITLKRLVANPYLVIGYIPKDVYQIDFQIINTIESIDILGNHYGTSQTPSFSWKDGLYPFRFVIFSLLCFPSTSDGATILLTIYRQNTRVEIKEIPLTIASNEYISMFLSF